MKNIFKFLSACLVVSLLMLLMNLSVVAQASNATISVSSTKVNVGDTITITANFTANSIGCIQAQLKYDASILEFIKKGNSANGGAGNVVMSYVANGPTSSHKIPITFKAKKAGVSGVSLSCEEFYSLENEDLGHPSASINLTVKDVTHNLSSNANLKSLNLSTGTLSPAFRTGTTSYTVTVPYETTRITMSAIAQDSSAKVTVNNINKLSVGTNTQTISIVAADGTQKKYTIRIIRKDKVNTSNSNSTQTTTETTVAETDEFPIEINGLKYKMVSDLSQVEAPGNCFSLSTCVINDAEVPIFKHNNADINVAYLTNQDNQSTFFIYDAENDTYSDYIPIKSGENLYVLTQQPADTSFEDYTKSTVSIGDFTVDAWNIPVNGETSDYYLVYAVNPSGETQWYQYDANEKTLQRYFENIKQVVNDVPIKTKPDFQLAYIIVIAVLFVSVVVLVILQIHNYKQRVSSAKHINRG